MEDHKQGALSSRWTCDEDTFDRILPKLNMQDLVETVQALQGEMEREQERFDSLSGRLSGLEKEQPEHDAVSTKLLESQTRLAMLVGRNMKCFTQQAANENQQLVVSKVQADLHDKENSAKDAVLVKNAANAASSDVTKSSKDINRNIHVPAPTNSLPKSAVVSSQRITKPVNQNPTTGLRTTVSNSHFVHNTFVDAPPWKMVKSNQTPGATKAGPLKAVHPSPQSSVPPQGTSTVPVPKVSASFTVRSTSRESPRGVAPQNNVQATSTPSHQSNQHKTDDSDNTSNERINFSAAFSMFESSTLPRGNNAKKKNFEIPKRSKSSMGIHKIATNQSSAGATTPTSDNTNTNSHDVPTDRSSAGVHPSFSSYTLPAKKSTTAVTLSKSINDLEAASKADSSAQVSRSISVHSQQADWSGEATYPRYSSYDAAGSIRKKPLKTNNTETNFTTLRNLNHNHQSSSQPNGSSSNTETNGQNPEKVHDKSSSNNREYVAKTTLTLSNKSTSQSSHNGAQPVVMSTIREVGNQKAPDNKEAIIPREAPVKSVQNHNAARITQQAAPASNNTNSVDAVKGPESAGHSVEIETSTQKIELTSNHVESSTKNETVSEVRAAVFDNSNVSKPTPVVSKTSPTPSNNVKRQAPQVPQNSISLGAPAVVPIVQDDKEGFTTDDLVKQRITLKDWDPSLLLKDLYTVKLQPDTEEHSQYVNMEGYMEKLPTNKKKATLLKTWKRRYFKAKNGTLYYFESQREAQDADLSKVETYWDESAGGDKASASFQLMGGSLEDLGAMTLGIDDGRGRYLVVRCPTDKEYYDWKASLKSQMEGNIKATYIKPVLSLPPSTKRKAVIIDIGSCSVRAGILRDKPSLPSVFFPNVVATDRSGALTIGFDALKPSVRASCTLSYPVRPSIRIDKSIDMKIMQAVFRKVFKDLGVDSSQYWVMLSSPANLSDKLKEEFMDILVKDLNVPGASIANQTLLAMYSYNAKSGIVVDIGDRLEILPVTDGYVVEGGVTKQVFGGRRVGDAFNIALNERKYPFVADIDYQIVRFAMEKMCFVSDNYDLALERWNADQTFCRDTLSLKQYGLPEGFVQDITLDLGRFNAPEGLFNTEVWGMDNPPLPKLIQKAVQASPVDTRREMWRSIYLSGGATMFPGFTERLQKELKKLVPPTVVVEVHASPQRYHAAFIGASTVAGLPHPQFENSCITADEWQKQGPKVLRKWHMY